MNSHKKTLVNSWDVHHIDWVSWIWSCFGMPLNLESPWSPLMPANFHILPVLFVASKVQPGDPAARPGVCNAILYLGKRRVLSAEERFSLQKNVILK